MSEFECFRKELLAGLAPAGGVEAMLAERIVSLSWRLKRVERMNSEALDVMIAKIETNWLDRRERTEAGLLDPENGRSELVLGWATIDDFSGSNAVLERLLTYEKRIESSLYKAMNELQKLQRVREREQAEAEQAIPILVNDHRDSAAPQSDEKKAEFEKQSQFSPILMGNSSSEIMENKANLIISPPRTPSSPGTKISGIVS